VNVTELAPFDPNGLTLDVLEQRLGEIANHVMIAADEQGDPLLSDYGVQLLALIDARRSMEDDPDRGAHFANASKAAESHCERYNRGPRTLAHERRGLLSFVSRHLADVGAAYVQRGEGAARPLAEGVARQLAVYPRLRARTRYARRVSWFLPARASVVDEIAAAVAKAVRAAKPAELVVVRIMHALGDEDADKLFDSDDDARTRRRR
jgi:hypothetical protein